MAIILLPKGSTGPALRLSRRASLVLCAALFVALPGVSLCLGYWIGSGTGDGSQSGMMAWVRGELKTQQQDIADAKRKAQDNLNALTLRLSDLQSRVVRLDAVGERLTEMANLDKGEFDFTKGPAVGGPENANAVEQLGVQDFIGSLDVLSKQVHDREQQLGVLESMLMTRNLQSQVFPAGFPAEHGWLSSYFGVRADPFTGHLARHEGIDIAGKLGTKILTVASGVVTWSGDRYGYGNLVEINHGNGYVTRYGHNSKLLVKVGETVKKGQAIALMGSTGRSTGPHVHFEVWRNGHVVDPLKYVQSATVTAATANEGQSVD